jgi:hypothetical protein
MGYVDGAGLGPDGEGILHPVAAGWKTDKRGLGGGDAADGRPDAPRPPPSFSAFAPPSRPLSASSHTLAQWLSPTRSPKPTPSQHHHHASLLNSSIKQVNCLVKRLDPAFALPTRPRGRLPRANLHSHSALA